MCKRIKKNISLFINSYDKKETEEKIDKGIPEYMTQKW